MTRGFSQNESSAWNGTGFINIEYAQGFECVVAGGYAVTLQSEVLSFPESEKYPALDSRCTVQSMNRMFGTFWSWATKKQTNPQSVKKYENSSLSKN